MNRIKLYESTNIAKDDEINMPFVVLNDEDEVLLYGPEITEKSRIIKSIGLYYWPIISDNEVWYRSITNSIINFSFEGLISNESVGDKGWFKLTFEDSSKLRSKFSAYRNSSLSDIIYPSILKDGGNSFIGYNENLSSIYLSYQNNSVTGITYSNLRNLVIPDSTTTITSINGNSRLKKIEIPSSVINITGTSLYNNYYTKMIVDPENPKYDSRNNCNAIIETDTNILISGCHKTIIPDDVVEIGPYAFMLCNKLTSLVIPNSVLKLNNDSIRQNSDLIEVILSNSLEEIKDRVFYYCTKLTHITFPESLLSIGSNAFEKVPLETLFIPKNVSSIKDNSFLYTASTLNSIKVDQNNQNYDSRNNCNAIINTSTNELVLGCVNTEIPSTVTKLGNNAFFFSTFNSIELPSNITSIGNKTFAYCKNLTTLIIPNTVSNIGINAFSDCINLKSITLPNSITKLSSGLLSNCKSLKNINIPNSVTIIDSNAITNCESLESLVLPDSVLTINKSGISNCQNLRTLVLSENLTSISGLRKCPNIKTIRIPKSTIKLDEFPFEGFLKLETIEVDSENPVYTVKNNCLYNKSDNSIIRSSINNNIIPEGTLKLDHYSFEGNTSTEIVIPEGVTYIGSSCFNNSNIRNITIPSTVTVIYSDAFYGTRLETIEVDSENPVYTVKNNCLYNKSNNSIIRSSINNNIIPEGTLELYKYSFEGNTSTEIVIPEGVTYIGSGCFKNCSNLRNITIPSTVTTILDDSLSGCSNITITYNGSLSGFPWGASQATKASTRRMLMSSRNVEKIYYSTIKYLDGTTITIPVNSVIEKTTYELYDVYNIEEIIIPEGVTELSNETFYGFVNLKNIVLPESLTNIGISVFKDCFNLKN